MNLLLLLLLSAIERQGIGRNTMHALWVALKIGIFLSINLILCLYKSLSFVNFSYFSLFIVSLFLSLICQVPLLYNSKILFLRYDDYFSFIELLVYLSTVYCYALPQPNLPSSSTLQLQNPVPQVWILFYYSIIS